jgi:hypothetical protein
MIWNWRSQFKRWRAGGKPYGVSDETWAEATDPNELGNRSCRAMADANRIAPGCVFANADICAKLGELLFRARHLRGGEAAEGSRRMLSVLFPHKPRGKAGGLTGMHLRAFEDVLGDIVVVRTVYEGLCRTLQSYEAAFEKLSQIFTQFRELDRDWQLRVSGHKHKQNPQITAAEIIGRGLGYKADSVLGALGTLRDLTKSAKAYGRKRGRMIIDAVATDQLAVEDFERLWGVGCPQCGWKMVGDLSPQVVCSASPVFALCGNCGAWLDPYADNDDSLLLDRHGVGDNRAVGRRKSVAAFRPCPARQNVLMAIGDARHNWQAGTTTGGRRANSGDR